MEARAGDRRALDLLARRWTPRLLRHARRLTRSQDRAEDAVQDAWVSVAGRLRRLDDPARFPAWIYRIVTRKCFDQFRRASRQTSALGVHDASVDVEHAQGASFQALSGGMDSQLAQSGSASPDQAGATQLDARIDLLAAVARLSPVQRALVSLYYGEGLSVAEIADTLELPAGTVKSRLFTARAELRAHLEGDTP